MKCQKCGKYDANTHISEIINGVKNEIYLCSHCAKNTMHTPEIESILSSSFDNFFAPFLKSPNSAGSYTASQKICKNCKSTMQDIQNSGRLGCSECYKAFEDLLLHPLKDIHGSNRHRGKIPKKRSYSNEAEQLKEELARAVEAQNFERAAELRDKIRQREA